MSSAALRFSRRFVLQVRRAVDPPSQSLWRAGVREREPLGFEMEQLGVSQHFLTARAGAMAAQNFRVIFTESAWEDIGEVVRYWTDRDDTLARNSSPP
jgi:hypothetical protein